MESKRFNFVQRLLHWLVAILAICVLAVGLTFLIQGGYEGTVELFGEELTNELYKYHKSFGILIFGLMVLRAVLRWRLPVPVYDPPITRVERVASRTVHILFYVILIAMPIGGWLATAAGGYPVQFFNYELPGLIGKDEELSKTLFQLHGTGGLVLLVLMFLHIAAGMRHFWKKDGVVRRIALP